MRKVFLDMGDNRGQGLRHFIEKYKIDSSWIVETFEPGKECGLEKEIEDLPYVKVNNLAIWKYTGKVSFSIFHGSGDVNTDSQGSSVECLMSDGPSGDMSVWDYRKHDDIVEVDCISISDVLNKYDDDDFILVKMDIEGSEFSVLRKALEDNTISKINDLWVEWHHHHIKGESMQTK